jgi:hypothetical protein
MAQTAVEWLFHQLNTRQKPLDNMQINELFGQAKEMEKEQSHNYADFCVRCDRDQMKLLDFNDYIKIYTNGL